MSASGPCLFLPWDTGFFGVRIGRVAGNRLSDSLVSEIERWTEAELIDCLYFLADFSDAETIRIAEMRGFRLTDVRVTLDLKLPRTLTAPVKYDPAIRHAVPEDAKALKAIARLGHTDSRFFFDGRFPKERCADLYETWIETSLGGYADTVFTADDGGRAAGYVSCHLDGPRKGRIGLVGVAAEARGRGLATGLTRAALHWFEHEGVERVSVVTQGRNVSAQRLYQSCGFTTCSVQLWYHRWFDRAFSRSPE
jgi:dTDP-4-amino-4,6-dideoxy-D-galactose acyltransferase